jgi:hypothetical protein
LRRVPCIFPASRLKINHNQIGKDLTWKGNDSQLAALELDHEVPANKPIIITSESNTSHDQDGFFSTKNNKQRKTTTFGKCGVSSAHLSPRQQ